MFYSNHLIGFGAAGSGSATATLVHSAVDASNVNTYTFSSATLGTGKIVVGAYHSGNTTNVTSLTVDGNAATELVTLRPAGDRISLYQYNGNTSSSGDIVVTLNASESRCSIAVWLVEGAADAVSATSSDNGGATPETTISVPSNGCVVAYVGGAGAATRTWSWTNLDEDVDAEVESGFSHSGASKDFSGAQTVTVTPDASASVDANRGLLVTAAFAPA